MRVVELLCSPLWRGGSHALVFPDAGGLRYAIAIVLGIVRQWRETSPGSGAWMYEGDWLPQAYDFDAPAELWPFTVAGSGMPYAPADVAPAVPAYKPTVADTAAPDERARGRAATSTPPPDVTVTVTFGDLARRVTLVAQAAAPGPLGPLVAIEVVAFGEVRLSLDPSRWAHHREGGRG